MPCAKQCRPTYAANMLVLCAPDSFKGTISAANAAAAMVRGVEAAGHQAIALPVADGGEGTGDTIVAATGGKRSVVETVNPKGRPIDGHWFDLGGRQAIVESAVASGLGLLSSADRKPTDVSSLGTGLLIAAAVDAGAKTVHIAVGGTGTVDGGCGLLQAIGVALLDESGNVLAAPVTPRHMHDIASFSIRRQLPALIALVDTTAPLLGPTGAAHVFAPQKGASETNVDFLEVALTHLADVLDPDCTARSLPGAGAGGGIGFAIAAVGGTIRSGAEHVLEAIQFEEHLAKADLVLTGEGCLDGQTASGKAPLAVAQAAANRGVPCVAIAGMLGDGYESLMDSNIFHSCTSLLEHVPIEEAMGDPAAAIEHVSKKVSKMF